MDDHRLPTQDIVEWVAREVVPLEPEIRFWLRRMKIADPDDVIQDVYCRLLSLRDVSHIDAPRAYLYRTARNIITDGVRRQALVKFETARHLDEMRVADTGPSPETIATTRAELKWVLGLIASLPTRCRAVMELRKVKGLSQAETARYLYLSENVVEKETAKGLRMISDQVKRAEFAPTRAKTDAKGGRASHG